MKIVNEIPLSGDFTVDCYPNGKTIIYVPSFLDIIIYKFKYIFKIGWKHYKIIRKT